MHRWVLWAVGGLTVMAGCGQAPSSPPALPASPTPAPLPSPTPSPGTASTVLVHVLDRTQASILTYAADPATGHLSPVGQVTGPAPSGARLAAHPSGRFVYAAESSASRRVEVRAYRVDGPRGTLTPVGTFASTYSLPAVVEQIVATSERVWLGADGAFTGTHGGLLAYDVNQSTGALASRGQITRYVEAHFVATGPGGHNLYVGALNLYDPPAEIGPLLVTLRIDGDAVSELWKVPLPGFVSAGAMYPLGRRLFLADDGDFHGEAPSLRTFVLSDGRPVEQASIPVAFTRELAPHPGGAFLGASGDAGLQIYAFDPATGSLTQTDEVGLAGSAHHLAWEPGGSFLYVSSPGDGIRIFEFDRGGGKLSEVDHLSEGGGSLVISTLPSE